MLTWQLVLFAALASWACLFLCRRAKSVGEALKVIDYPDVAGGRKRHAVPTPLTGGIATLVATAVTAPLFIFLTDLSVSQDKQVSVIAFVTAVFALLGFIDDRHTLSPKIRLLVLVLLVAAVLTNEPALTVSFLYFSFLPNAYILGDWGVVFTMISIVGFSNAVNMADGKNGLVIGLSIIWCLALLALNVPAITPILVALLSALCVTMMFNMKGKLFLGDAGSFGLSAFIALSSIYAYTQNFVDVPADIIVLMFLVPVADCLRLMVARVLVGRSPFSPGRDHLHHYIAMRFGWTSGLPIYLGLVGCPLAAALLFDSMMVYALVVQFTAYCGILALSVFTAVPGEAGVAPDV